jgi:uncharacterized protein (TIGR03089 family)
MTTVSILFAAATGTDATRPLLTYYDDSTGERTELSGATLGNWLAKTANLLVDGVGAAPGDRALVLLPPHWQTAAVLLGCWSAGLSVRTEPAAGAPPEVAFVAADRAAAAIAAGERFALGLHPLGLPLREVPPGYLDYVAEMRVHGDRFVPVDSGTSEEDELGTRAVRRAGELGIGPGDRVLVDASRYPDSVDWLLAPLAATASIVLCGHMDPARLPGRIAAEQVTVALTEH